MKSSHYILFFLITVISPLYSSAQTKTSEAFIQCLRNTHFPLNQNPISQLNIYTPTNTSYTPIFDFLVQNLRFLNDSSRTKPIVIVTPVDESQIRKTILCARRNNIQIRIRSGGHDFEGLSYSTPSPVDFAMIDMINFRSIDIDVASGTAWVGPTATLGELYYYISEKSRTFGFPGGGCPTVGLGGFIGGGGYGIMKRKYGLGADNTIDVRFIDVNGRILDRKSMGEDLFWAIRGGVASSFGVVVAWKLKLVAVPETVTVFQVTRTLEQNGTALLQKWQTVAPKLDRDLYIRVTMRTVTQQGRNRTVGIAFESLFLGGTERLLSVLSQSFPELGLAREDCREMSWVRAMIVFGTNFGAFSIGESTEGLLNRTAFPKLTFKITSEYVKVPLSLEALQGLWERFYQVDDGLFALGFMPYGGRMDDYSESDLPFPHRAGNLYMMFISIVWDANTSVAEQTRRLNFIRSLSTYLTPYVSKNPREAYVNYNNLDFGVGTSYEEAAKWGNRYFKNNFERLVKIKTAVDPTNFLRHEQSIPTFNAI